jgi:hypothetical protein
MASILGVFASGFVGHWIWSSYSQVQQEVLPNELLDIEESGAVRTIYKHDTIYIPQYSNESFVLEKQLPNYSMTDFQKEITKTNLLLKSSLLETQVDYKNLMLDYTYAQSKLSELRQQLKKQRFSPELPEPEIDRNEITTIFPLPRDSKIGIEPLELFTLDPHPITFTPLFYQRIKIVKEKRSWGLGFCIHFYIRCRL